MVSTGLVAGLAAPAAAQTCRFDGTAPWCAGECGDNEVEITRLDAIPPHWEHPAIQTPPFGSDCWVGTKALCCPAQGRSCRWDGTAPFCDGECKSHEKQSTPPENTSSGASCWTGSKVYCCLASTGTVTGPLTSTPPAETDGDGVVDSHDNCPFAANPNQVDTDADHHGDACDNCPFAANLNQLDTDFDTQGDACDDDDDGDGCKDADDQHPTQSSVKVATYTPGPLCSSDAAGPVYGYEGADTDRDGMLDCKDSDDDNDGITDAQDPCTTVHQSQRCTFLKDCPGAVPWSVCAGGGCAALLLKVSWVVNPAPGEQQVTDVAQLDRFWIEGGALYIAPEVNGQRRDVQDVMRLLSVPPSRDAGRFRLEIASRAAAAQAARPHALVAEYAPAQVIAGQDRVGSTLRVVPPQAAGAPMLLDASRRIKPGQSSGSVGARRAAYVWGALFLAAVGLITVLAVRRRASRGR